MVYPKLRSMTDRPPSPDGSWDSQTKLRKRQWVISELEQIFAQYGNPLPKDSAAVEARLFEASRTQVEYLALARRLIYTTSEMAKNEQMDGDAADLSLKPSTSQKPKLPIVEDEDSLNAANSLLDMSNQEEEQPSSFSSHQPSAVFSKTKDAPSPFVVPARPPVIVAPQTTSASSDRRRIDNGLIRLPNLKRQTENNTEQVAIKRRKTSAGHDMLEVVTQMDYDENLEGEVARTELPVNETYEATVTVLIPKGYRIGRMNVMLRKDAEE
ncbi:hypothetical protein RvY_04079 [Ramazzottius varieornatus]|uniref:Mediator of RNA polymerase II transcription subunit 15 n=1 Tax=Ramazzottius varieornatus TaxID=947166 RepID=A0A1D1UVZ8_RAMVA|nr:hypothetical protein RvY_04079 [Ramazzottius varieornatus]